MDENIANVGFFDEANQNNININKLELFLAA